MLPSFLTTTSVLLLSLHSASAASYSPTLDVNNAAQLTEATSAALKNLLGYYQNNNLGVYNQQETPWHESGMIWGTYFDHLKWSGDGQFVNTVTEALANMSFNSQQDFLDGAQASLQQTLEGKWNDDILWPSQAIIAGAEIFGYNTVMPATSGGKWITTAQFTFDEAYQQWDEGCDGGIYWSRDRNSPSKNYKSVITNLEFVSQGARNYLQSKNQTALNLAEQTMDWVISSGLANAQTGDILDGKNVGSCNVVTGSQWTYNYGEMLGALSWMHLATGNDTYLTMATPFLNKAIAVFTSNSSGVITEQCEVSKTCNRDQQGFKGILVRNLAYLWRETQDPSVKKSIQTVIDTSVASMVKNSCDANWNCGGNWTTDTAPVKHVRSQHVSSALLVAALSIHTSPTGSGLLTNINAQTLSTTTSGTGTAAAPDANGQVPGMIVSRPLNGGGKLGGRDTWFLAMLLLGGVLLIVS